MKTKLLGYLEKHPRYFKFTFVTGFLSVIGVLLFYLCRYSCGTFLLDRSVCNETLANNFLLVSLGILLILFEAGILILVYKIVGDSVHRRVLNFLKKE